MGLKPDYWIREHAKKGMIDPFVGTHVTAYTASSDYRQIKFSEIDPACTYLDKPEPTEIVDKAISYGLSSYGYDMRVAREFRIFTNYWPGIIDPKAFNEHVKFHDFVGDVCIVPPNSFALARSVEYFRIPKDILCIVVGKSTYARCGIVVNITALEPEWEGEVTIEISNTTPLPAKIYSGEGIAQVLFFQGDGSCDVTYADKKGKYQRQKGITMPRV